MATGLVTSPFLFKWLESDRFGLFRTMTDLFGYLTLLEFGLSGALAPLLAGAMGREDQDAERRTMAAGMRAYLVVSVLSLICGLLLSVTITSWTSIPNGLEHEARIACLVYSLSFIWIGSIPFRAALEARQRNYVINLLLTGQALIISSLSILLAWLGWGVVGQAIAIVTGISFFNLSIFAGRFRSNLGVLRSAIREPLDFQVSKSLRNLSGSSMILQLSGRLGTMTDNIILAFFIDQKAVSILFFTQRLPVMVLSLLQGVSSATWAGLSELHARGEHDTYRNRLIELSGLVSILAVAALGPVVAYNDHFIDFWVGGESNGGNAIVIVAAINTFLTALLTLWSWSFTATGQIGKLVPLAVGSALFNLTLSVGLTWKLGVIGPLLGTAAAFLLLNIWMIPQLLYRSYGVSRERLAVAVCKPLAVGIPYCGLLWWVARQHRPWGLIGLATEMALAGSGFLVVAFFLVLNQSERSTWVSRIRNLIPVRPAPSPIV